VTLAALKRRRHREVVAPVDRTRPDDVLDVVHGETQVTADAPSRELAGAHAVLYPVFALALEQFADFGNAVQPGRFDGCCGHGY
jgi:hypothetical protein